MKSKRLANMELLRIIAMLMVIMLHWLGKGNLLGTMNLSMNATDYLVWILENLSIVAVNVYVLISGYFLVQNNFRVGKMIELIAQVLFYVVGITVLGYCVGFVGKEQITVSLLLQEIFSFHSNQYWFVTVYIVMYMLSPILATGIRNMTKKQLQISIICLLVWNCLIKSISPIALSFDRKGYELLWFVCLFMVAAYVRLHGIPFLERKRFAALLYLGGCFLMFLESLVLGILYEKAGSLAEITGVANHYNHIFCFLASVGIFSFFLKVEIPEGKLSTFICKIAPYTFGVYLLHEHNFIRYLWPTWMGVEKVTGVGTFLFYTFRAVIVVFAVGIIVDWIRSVIFKVIKKLLLPKCRN